MSNIGKNNVFILKGIIKPTNLKPVLRRLQATLKIGWQALGGIVGPGYKPLFGHGSDR